MFGCIECLGLCRKLFTKRSSEDEGILRHSGGNTNYQVRRVSRAGGTLPGNDDEPDSKKEKISRKVSKEPKFTLLKDPDASAFREETNSEQPSSTAGSKTPENLRKRDKVKNALNIKSLLHHRKGEDINLSKSTPDLSKTGLFFMAAPPPQKPKRKNAIKLHSPEYVNVQLLSDTSSKYYTPGTSFEDLENKQKTSEDGTARSNKIDNMILSQSNGINIDTSPKLAKKNIGIEENPKIKNKSQPELSNQSHKTSTASFLGVGTFNSKLSKSTNNIAGDTSSTCGIDINLYRAEEIANRKNITSTPVDLHQPVSAGGGGSGKGKTDPAFEVTSGTIQFLLGFDKTVSKLFVKVTIIQDLPMKREKIKYPVQLKIALISEEGKVITTKNSKAARDSHPLGSKSGQLLPCKFDEDFSFECQNLNNLYLRISVCDASNTGKYNTIGNTIINLEEANLSNIGQHFCNVLTQQTEPCNENKTPGLLQTHISYDFRDKKLYVLVLQYRELINNLTGSKINIVPENNKSSTTYIKATLYLKGQKHKSKKSEVVINDFYYNHGFGFNVSIDLLFNCTLVISMMGKSRLKSDTLIGKVILGPYCYSNSSELTPWGNVLLSKQTVSHCYKLKI